MTKGCDKLVISAGTLNSLNIRDIGESSIKQGYIIKNDDFVSTCTTIDGINVSKVAIINLDVIITSTSGDVITEVGRIRNGNYISTGSSGNDDLTVCLCSSTNSGNTACSGSVNCQGVVVRCVGVTSVGIINSNDECISNISSSNFEGFNIGDVREVSCLKGYTIGCRSSNAENVATSTTGNGVDLSSIIKVSVRNRDS